MEKIPTWIERLLLPKLNEIIGAIKALHSRIDSVEKEIGNLGSETKAEITSLRTEVKTEIGSLRNEVMAKFEVTDNKVAALDTKVDSLRNEAISRFDAVDTRLGSIETRTPVMEKISELEVRVTELAKKLADKPEKEGWWKRTQKKSSKRRGS